jgi:hypothetical protein
MEGIHLEDAEHERKSTGNGNIRVRRGEERRRKKREECWYSGGAVKVVKGVLNDQSMRKQKKMRVSNRPRADRERLRETVVVKRVEAQRSEKLWHRS